MDWKEIKEKYPKALELCSGWLHKKRNIFFDNNINEFSTFMSDARRFHIRDLFDFFDNNDIIISVMYCHHNSIQTNKGYFCVINQTAYTNTRGARRLAKKEAFEKAFEILNNKLNGTNN